MNDRPVPSATLDDLLALAAGRADESARQRVHAVQALRPEVGAELDQWRAIAGAVAESAADRSGQLPAVGGLLAAARIVPGGAATSSAAALGGGTLAAIMAALSILAGVVLVQGRMQPAPPPATTMIEGMASAGDPTIVARRGPARQAADAEAMPLSPRAGANTPSADVRPSAGVPETPSAHGALAATSPGAPAFVAAPAGSPTPASSVDSHGLVALSTPARGALGQDTPADPSPTGTEPPPAETAPSSPPAPTATTATPSDGEVVFAIDDPAGEVTAYAWPLDGGAVQELAVIQGSRHRLPVGRWLFVAQPGDSEPTWLGDRVAASNPFDLAPVHLAPGQPVTMTWRFRALGDDRATIHGRVESADGEPAERAVVHARDGSGRILSVIVLPADDGRFDIGIPAGEWSLAAVAEPTAPPMWGTPFALPPRAISEPIVLHLP